MPEADAVAWEQEALAAVVKVALGHIAHFGEDCLEVALFCAQPVQATDVDAGAAVARNLVAAMNPVCFCAPVVLPLDSATNDAVLNCVCELRDCGCSVVVCNREGAFVSHAAVMNAESTWTFLWGRRPWHRRRPISSRWRIRR